MTDTTRRIFLQGSLATGAIGAALAAGILTPQTVLAVPARPGDAFQAKDLATVLEYLESGPVSADNPAIKIRAPDIAENGAVVPITVETDLPDVTQIAIIASTNPFPLAADFRLTEHSVPFVSTRIKMGKTGDVVAIVKAGGTVYTASKTIKVTIGGCGG
jgi:sulfur-oxidizing protein SoxY